MDDASIVKLFWDRSEQALAVIAQPYGRFCTSIAKNILGSDEDAEECVNDAYLAVWNSIPPRDRARAGWDDQEPAGSGRG